MSGRTKKEKRLHPRIAHELPLRIAVNGYDFSTSTHNISCVGAYCHLDKYMPPFTKIRQGRISPSDQGIGGVRG